MPIICDQQQTDQYLFKLAQGYLYHTLGWHQHAIDSWQNTMDQSGINEPIINERISQLRRTPWQN